jgi:hypothetical protein
MCNFKEFLYERVYRLEANEQEQVNTVIDNYIKLFNKDVVKKLSISGVKPIDFYIKHLNKQGLLPIGNINFIDNSTEKHRELPVFVSFSTKSKDRGLYELDIDDNGNITKEHIILYYYKLSLTRKFIEDALVHELFHAKQPHKTPRENYRKNKTTYYLDPTEVHNFTSNIIKMIEDQYNSGTVEEKDNLLTFLEQFARRGKSTSSNFNVPDFLKGKQEFLRALVNNKNNPKYKEEYKRFFKKIYYIYTQLVEK